MLTPTKSLALQKTSSTKKLFKDLLDNDVVNNICEPAIQVCQWCARAVDGSLFNSGFWYNSGGLKGDKLLEQFIQVVIQCETIGV